MNTDVFDGMARELGAVSTRRNVFRLLGGAAALSAGLALTARDASLGKSRGKSQGKARTQDQVTAQRRGGRKITICDQGQTRTVKKKKLGTYPGATRGACPTGPGGGGGQPVVCTTYVLSGGPKPSDPITIDDDGSILNVTTGKFLLIDNTGQASAHSPVFSPGQVGDRVRVRATDYGGCRSFSPLWLHCLESGQRKQVFSGDRGNGSCTNPKQVDYLDITFPLEI